MSSVDCCGVCGGRLFHAETITGAHGRTLEVAQCGDCGVLCNWTSLTSEEILDSTHMQEDCLENVYEWPDEASAQRRLLTEYSDFLEQALKGLEISRSGKFLDVGCGRGLTAMAACAIFDEVVATDLRPDLLEEVCRDLGRPRNLQVHHGLFPGTGRFDVIWAWHVLEHLPHPLEMLTTARSLLVPSGRIVLQVPLFRPAYVFDQHLYFYNQHTLTTLAMRCGLAPVNVGFDLERSFMSAVLEQSR